MFFFFCLYVFFPLGLLQCPSTKRVGVGNIQDIIKYCHWPARCFSFSGVFFCLLIYCVNVPFCRNVMLFYHRFLVRWLWINSGVIMFCRQQDNSSILCWDINQTMFLSKAKVTRFYCFLFFLIVPQSVSPRFKSSSTKPILVKKIIV